MDAKTIVAIVLVVFIVGAAAIGSISVTERINDPILQGSGGFAACGETSDMPPSFCFWRKL